MIAAKREFNTRIEEIEKYFQLIEKIENNYRTLSNSEESFLIDEELFKVLKANGFMLLYNLIESTVLNCIIAVFDRLLEEGLSYSKVSEQIKKYWLKYYYKHDDKIKKEKVIDQFFIITDGVLKNLPLNIKIDKIDGAGSLDTSKIKSVAEELGVIMSLPRYRENLHGQVFQKIKKNRNDLAHGKSTFSTIGRDITFIGDNSDGARSMGLTHYKRYTIEHLEDFIADIEIYLLNKKYSVEEI